MKALETILADSRIFNHSKYLGFLECGMVHLSIVGSCTVVWCPNEDGYEHVSIAPTHKYRIPSWQDMAELKSIFFEDDEEAYQIMPKNSEYVNIKDNCLHLWRPANGRLLSELVRSQDEA